jgi:hypothetical protein
MRNKVWWATVPLLLVFGVAEAKPKKPEDPPPPPPAAEPPPPPVVEPEPLPEPAPAAAPAPNADLKVVITHADGTSKSGRVTRIERGEDWFAENGWVDTPPKLTITLASGGTEVDKTWNDIASIDVKYAAKTEVDCVYDSNFTPWMYMCTLPTTSTAKTKDGKTWSVDQRHKWRFTFDDGSTEEFYLFKLPVRKQDSEEVSFDAANSENRAMYADLQAEVQRQAARAVTKVTVSP